MARAIWKYSVAISDRETALDIPQGGKVVHVEDQFKTDTFVEMWVEVSPENSPEKRAFVIHGTGHPIPDDGEVYVGTALSGQFVWHVFEVNGYVEV